MQNFLTQILSDLSFQFIVIFIIKLSVLSSRLLGKKSGTFVTRRFIVCILFCAGISMSCIEAHMPIDKK